MSIVTPSLAVTVATLLRRELAALRREVEAYPDDASLWLTPPGIANSAGNLVLHLMGNLRHYVGAVLGGTGYRRDRPVEFATRGLPRTELIAAIDATAEVIQQVVPGLSPAILAAEYPEVVVGQTVQTGDYLVHLAVHAGYHLGQVDYHRRLVTGDGATAGAVSIPAMASARPAPATAAPG